MPAKACRLFLDVTSNIINGFASKFEHRKRDDFQCFRTSSEAAVANLENPPIAIALLLLRQASGRPISHFLNTYFESSRGNVEQTYWTWPLTASGKIDDDTDIIFTPPTDARRHQSGTHHQAESDHRSTADTHRRGSRSTWSSETPPVSLRLRTRSHFGNKGSECSPD